MPMMHVITSIYSDHIFSFYPKPMHEDHDIRQEQLNKASIMSSKTFLQGLLDMFRAHVVRVESLILLFHVNTFMYSESGFILVESCEL